jgi:hypothetical protein
MKICDHVTEKCFEPNERYKEPCPHAIAHDPLPTCVGKRCDRFAVPKDGKETEELIGSIFTKHVEI